MHDIKEKLYYITLDFEQEKATVASSFSLERATSCLTFQWPGHHHQQQRIPYPPGALPPFLPGHGILWHPTVNSIMKCDMDIRKDLHVNTGLSGGTTMYPGVAGGAAEGDHCPGVIAPLES
ncbi:hypothetical protein H8958_009221 [Nasalis larvatus]